MKLEAAIREYLIEIEIRKYTPKTRKGYRTSLNLYLRFCTEKLGITDMEDITLSSVKQFTKMMTDLGRKGTYINSLLKSIKSFLQYSYEVASSGVKRRNRLLWLLHPLTCARYSETATAMILYPCGIKRF